VSSGVVTWVVTVRGGRAGWNDLVCAACSRPFVKGEWIGTLVEPDPAGSGRPVPCSGRLHHACALTVALVVNAEHEQALAAGSDRPA